MDEIKVFIVDLKQMIPETSHKYIDWDQTRSGEYVVQE